MYDVSRERKFDAKTLRVDFEKEIVEGNVDLKCVFVQNPEASPFDFGVVSTSKSQSVSPFELPDALLNLASVLAPIICEFAFLP